MTDNLRRLAERVDALALRERLLIFCAAALLLVFGANALLVEPVRARERRLAQEMKQQQAELNALRVQLQSLLQASAVDPDAANRQRRTALTEELRLLNARIVDEQRRFTPPEQMRRVLAELLERNRGLALVDLKTLPVAPVAASRPAGSSAGMYRHGIELTVRGSYGELYQYLQGLEKLPNQLYWARAELHVEAHPSLVLKLTVHTLSFDRAWLVV